VGLAARKQIRLNTNHEIKFSKKERDHSTVINKHIVFKDPNETEKKEEHKFENESR
jgi:hypothetical protein